MLAAISRLLLISVILIGLVTGCGPKYGGSYNSYGNADHMTTTEVIMQLDLNGQLLFVIAWTAKRGGGTTSFSDRNLLTSVHGQDVHPSLNRRALYALQADGSLQQIPLSNDQLAALFEEIGQVGFHPSHSELWQKAVAPSLIKVEATNGS